MIVEVFLAHLSMECSVSYCDHSQSVGVCLSVHNFLVYTLASTNINQSTPNLVKMYMIIGSQMSSILKIMDQIEPEHPELFAPEFGKIAESDFVYTLASANIDQRAPNLVKMYVNIRSQMSSIMDIIKPELSEKFAKFDFVYTIASANIYQSVPNLATIYMPIRSRISLIMGQIKPEHPELFALEF